MDSRKDDLLVTFLRQDLYFLLHVLRAAASDAASRVRDDAVAAELVAAVLNLDEGAGVLRLLVDMKLLVLVGSSKVRNGLPDLFSGKPRVQKRNEVRLAVVSDDQVNGGILSQFVRRRLDITSCRNYHRVRIFCLRAVQHLAGFFICNVRHGTGVDDIDIRFFLKAHDLIASGLQKLFHGLRFVCIYFAAKIVQRCFSHILVSL